MGADTDLCPVNVHWHLGTEHRSEGQLALKEGGVRQGMLCHHYKEDDPKFTTPYEWKYCKDMEVGQTYEVHWPHSAAGACGTKWQYQYPFYDGVFCRDGIITIAPLNTYKTVGVQGQVFTIVNDGKDLAKAAYKPPENLMLHAWKD